MKKRILSMILSIVMVVAMLPLSSLTAFAADDLTVTVDKGSVTLKDTNGDGYYEIGTADELYAFAAAVNGGNTTINGILTADITVNTKVLSATGEPNSGSFRTWTPIGNKTEKFSGIFDGNAHSISGLYLKGSTSVFDSSTKYVGLFGYASNGIIRNVTVKDSFFSGYEYIGGIVGCCWSTLEMENCVSYATVKGFQHIGGVAGSIGYSSATNCHNHGLVMGSNMIGGFAGSIEHSSVIKNCSNTGTVMYDSGAISNLGGFVAYVHGTAHPQYRN